MGDQHFRADWVILGAKTDDGVMLIASKELGVVELQAELDDEPLTSWRSSFATAAASPRITSWELSGRLYSYVVVIGATYAEALQRLMSMGDPETWKWAAERGLPGEAATPNGPSDAPRQLSEGS